MKKSLLINIIAALAALLPAVFLASCEPKEIEPVEGETLAVTTELAGPVLDQRNAGANALDIRWTSGTNHKTGKPISYTLEIDRQGNNYSGGMKFDIGKTSSRMLSFTHQELNDSILKYWPDYLEKAIDLQVRVTAAVDGFDNQVAETSFSVTTYKWRVLVLYMIGSATPGGWSNDKVTAMSESTTETGVFTYNGVLTDGEFRFTTTVGDFWPGYAADPSDNSKLAYYEDTPPDGSDISWNVVEGNYTITVNLETLSIDIRQNSVTQNLYIVGDFNSWKVDSTDKMTINGDGSYTYEGVLSGEFKFVSRPGAWFPCYVKAENDDNKMIYRTEENQDQVPDFKWTVSTAVYRVDVNTKDLTISIQKTGEVEAWLMGEAIPDGWNWDALPEMTSAGNGVFLWTGTLSKGQIKFPLEFDRNFRGVMAFAKFDNTSVPPVNPDDDKVSVYKNGPDNKWYVNEAGSYTIRLDLNAKTVQFTKY